jgi:hypothetical protein
MPSNGELLARIRQLEEETARLQLLIAELVLKNQHLRRCIPAWSVGMHLDRNGSQPYRNNAQGCVGSNQLHM